MSASKKKSCVWNFFKPVGEGDTKFVKCSLCKREYKHSGNTSNLSDHLKRKHPGQLSSVTTIVTERQDHEIETTNSEKPSSPKQRRDGSLKTYFNRTKLYDTNSKEKKELDSLYTQMIVKDFMPFRTSEREGFKNFVAGLNNRYELPERTVLKTTLIPSHNKELRQKMKLVLEEVKCCSITTDMWTSVANEGILAVTCHFVHQGQLKSPLLKISQIEGRHTSEAMSQAISDILSEFNIREKVVTMVTDNAQSMVKTADLLKINHLPCFAHTLNLVVQNCFKISSFSAFLSKAKAIVSFFRSSTLASDNLKKIQRQNNKSELKLIQEVDTRWNSSFYMLKRLIEVRGELASAIGQSQKAPPPLTAENFEAIQEITQLLECFDTATTTMSGEKFVTSSLIIPLTRGISAKLISLETSVQTGEGLDVLKTLTESVSKRLKSYYTKTVLMLSTLLDPRFKKTGFRSSQDADYAIQVLQKEYAAFISANATQNINHEDDDLTPPQPSTSGFGARQSKIEELLFFTSTRTQQNSRMATPTSDAIIDVRQYLEKPLLDRSASPVRFWDKSENKLRETAFKFLGIPATSVPSERIFSKAGQVMTQKRNKLKAKHLNDILFLKHNYDIFK